MRTCPPGRPRHPRQTVDATPEIRRLDRHQHPHLRTRTDRNDRIVGPDVGDQVGRRPQAPVRDLDQFLEFLAQLDAFFGPIERPRPFTTGDRFLL